MTSTTDRILDIIDAGLQSSTEGGEAVDLWPDYCARCQDADRPDDGDLCHDCRAFLLGDSDDDPITRIATQQPILAFERPDNDPAPFTVTRPAIRPGDAVVLMPIGGDSVIRGCAPIDPRDREALIRRIAEGFNVPLDLLVARTQTVAE